MRERSSLFGRLKVRLEEILDLALFFDGSCKPNPGGIAGYGFVVTRVNADESIEVLSERNGFVGQGSGMTSNLAEWTALSRGLQFILENLNPNSLKIFGDSKLVINQLKGDWKVKDERLAILWRNCQDLIGQLEARLTISHIPRKLNSLADRLANV